MTSLSLPKISTNVRNFIGLASLRLGLSATAALAPAAALAWAERLFITPQRHDWPAPERQWLAQARLGRLHTAGMPLTRWDGLALQTYRWGEPRRGKVVLMHGWAGRATQLGYFIEPLVAAGFEVIAIDAPAHGASEGRQASVLHFANALTRLIRNEGDVSAVIAHSLGGAATIYALSQSTLPVGRVALISPSSDLAAYARQIGRLLRLSDSLLRRLQARMETRFGILWRDLEALPRAAGLNQPALVVHDHADREVPVATGRNIAATWPGAELMLTEGLGHRRILRDQAVVERVVAFVAA
ncbi:alpha/beta hydrolase [Chitinimonas sp.]|uniref:alpha/beta hydrolase n=1 Tax=Chitinimonas sp. TaxID=1934313 RepID=UPI0035ADF7E6